MIETIKIGTLKWHHILNPTDENLQYLKDNYHFHPLDIEDCKTINQRSKIDIYDDYYFLILHFPGFDKKSPFLRTKEVKIFWGEDYIITLGQSHWLVYQMFQEVVEQKQRNEEFEIGTTDALLYRILERVITESLPIIRRVGNELDYLNQELFNKKAEKTIEQISIIRKNIILLNTIFKPQLRLFAKFETGSVEGFAENMEDYWGNILDYYQRMWDMTEDYEELIEGLSKTFDSLQTNKINEIMKVLTMVSAILLPLTFITGLYGMNLDWLPYSKGPYSFWVIITSMFIIATTMIFYFKRRKWM